MKWHIAATPRCKHAWEKDILASNSNTIWKPNITDMEVDKVGSSNLNSWDDLQDFVFDPSPELASPSKCIPARLGSLQGRENPVSSVCGTYKFRKGKATIRHLLTKKSGN